MAELRCNTCTHLKEGFCSKLNEPIPNGLAKLFYGGAKSILAGTVTYPSECGIEKQRTELEMQVVVPRSRSESDDEEEAKLADPSLAVDNSDW